MAAPCSLIAGPRVPIKFEFWDSNVDQLQDGRASYGTGFQFRFLGGLQFNWVWSKRFDYLQYDAVVTSPTFGTFVKVDGGSTRQDFYIIFDF